jgi:hypothetical protein
MRIASHALKGEAELFFGCPESAAYLGMSVNTFRRSWRSRGIPAHYITPLRPSFRRSDLDEWRTSQRVRFCEPHNSREPFNAKTGFRVSLK